MKARIQHHGELYSVNIGGIVKYSKKLSTLKRTLYNLGYDYNAKKQHYAKHRLSIDEQRHRLIYGKL